MRISSWLSSGTPCGRFDTDEKLYEGLRKLDHQAILCLQTKSWRSAQKLIAQRGLPSELAEEIVNSATMVVLQKIGSGAYQFQGNAISTYFIEVVKRQTLMAVRTFQNRTAPANGVFPDASDPDFEDQQRRQEAAEIVGQLLEQLGQPCADVVRLHHIEGYSDEEVINQKLTKYTTTDSLKVKRSDCMKKLVQLAMRWKTSTNI